MLDPLDKRYRYFKVVPRTSTTKPPLLKRTSKSRLTRPYKPPLPYQQAQWQQSIHAPGANEASIAPMDEVFANFNIDLSRYDSEVVKVGSFKLVILGDDNFREWEEYIQRFCRMKRILGLIDGSLPRPLTGVKRAHWNIYADFLILVITNYVIITQRAHLKLHLTPKQIYDRWREVHVVKFRGRLVPLLRRIMTKKAERNESVDNVSADLRNLVEQVTLINGKPCVTDEMLGMAIMSAFVDNRKYRRCIRCGRREGPRSKVGSRDVLICRPVEKERRYSLCQIQERLYLG